MATFLNYVSMMILSVSSVTLAASCLQLVWLVIGRDSLAAGSRDFIILGASGAVLSQLSEFWWYLTARAENWNIELSFPFWPLYY